MFDDLTALQSALAQADADHRAAWKAYHCCRDDEKHDFLERAEKAGAVHTAAVVALVKAEMQARMRGSDG